MYFETGPTTACYVLGTLVPPERTLLWAFTAHYFFLILILNRNYYRAFRWHLTLVFSSSAVDSMD